MERPREEIHCPIEGAATVNKPLLARTRRSTTASLLAFAVLVAGCATVDQPSPDPRPLAETEPQLGKAPAYRPDPHLLGLLRDGETKREEIVLQLGPPARTMENERVLFYRLGQSPQGYFVQETRSEGWADVRHSLVLVLDEQGVLQRHSLVNVR
ncbi:MAG: hypothetical protein L0Y58_24790 [Verrucomicrobia subdivision 3 bacterium]|nr:hypothetical protein [Limisphaerales bacterium]